MGFLGVAGLTTLPQVVTTPLFVGVVYCHVAFPGCFRNDSHPNGGHIGLRNSLGCEANYSRLTPPGCPILVD